MSSWLGATVSVIFISNLFPELLVLAVGGSLAPPLFLLTILLLGSRRPLPNATALVLGYFVVCAAIGVAGLALFGGATGVGSAVSMVARVLSAAVGSLLIILALRSFFNAPAPDSSPPRWMGSVSSMSPAKAFGLGMALFPVQIKNLAIFVACVNLIATTSPGSEGSAVALVLVLLVFAIPVSALIGLYAAAPQRASKMLRSLRAWMENNNRAITVVLCSVFGAFFLARGLLGT